MADGETVNVSLLHDMRLTLGEGETIQYKAGMRQMPYAHAQALGVTQRIRQPEQAPTGEKKGKAGKPKGNPAYTNLSSVFDAQTATILGEAGYQTLQDLGRLTEARLRALPGIGPARVQEVITYMNPASAHSGGVTTTEETV